MENFWSENIDAILSLGQSLEELGVRNWALQKDTALEALDRLLNIGVPILGGDVYVVKNDSLEQNYDNWYCERNEDETNADFIERSVSFAKRYISSYKINGRDVYFSIVPEINSV